MKRVIDLRRCKLKRDIGESGLTLVEVLASLVILTIVFISFFAFFTQSATFTKHNKEKLSAVDIAESVVADIRHYKNISKLIEFSRNAAGEYENTTSYPGFKVKIEENNGPVDSLTKAIISVETDTDIGVKGSSFTTEMYFEEVTP